ncbi:MAG: iron-sulfur cluster carrier protein ApbC [Pseudomonadota bacterium]
MSAITNIIAVASGKGGVGKSTTSVNLALALKLRGHDVGLLDADIYGPSQQLMLGVSDDTHPEQHDGKFLLPVEAHGLKTMSMGYLVTERTPMVWRGPMAGGALAQMLQQTLWGELDYLVIDMPPGTGDVQLTLSQKAKVSGAVIVTTPQDIAVRDAQKGIEMFKKVEIPILGVVENMAVHVCSQCGHEEHIFGADGGSRIAEEYGVQLLGSLPLSLAIREQTDSGRPTVIADPGSSASQTYLEIADKIRARLASKAEDLEQGVPNINISDD